MKQAEYWKKRAEELEAALHQQTLRKSEEIDEQFDKAYHALDGQIKAWYQRVAVNNQVSLQEARKLLTNKERKEFQWDIEEYIKHGKENGLTGQWMRELENASAKQHISRLEQIKIQTQQEAEKLYGNYVDEIDQHMRDTYREDYYRTAYNFQMGAGVCYDLAGIDEKALERVIRKPWAADGKNFTDRCWEGKDNLVHTLHTTLTQMCITGEGIASASGKFRKAVDVGKYQADRLIRTESAYFQTAAQKDCYSELGVSEVEIMATLDEATCDICGALDGTHLPLAEAEEGVSTPPFHCNCRCTTVPYYGDTLGMDGRAMRDADGGYDTVPSDLKFEDWKERYVGKAGNSSKNAAVKKYKSKFESTENEKSTKSTPEHDFNVKFDPKSEAFVNKIKSFGESEEITHTIKNGISAMMKHRGGTKYEDMIFIDSKTNEHHFQRKYNVESEVMPTIEMQKMVKNSEPYTVIAIHNHPQSHCPSLSDLKTNYTMKYKYGVAVGHNGIVYKYSVRKKIPSRLENFIDVKLARLDNSVASQLYEKKKEVYNILNELKDYGIELEVL